MGVHLILILVSSLFTFLPAEKESINWRSRRVLTWSDFKGTAVEAAPNAAMTSTSILIDFGYDKRSMHYHLSCVFYPEKSWTKVSSTHILSHEQGHFDISQLYTRKLHKALSAYQFKSSTVDRDVKAIYEKIASEQSRYQVLYDQQTNYSRNTNEQVAWEEKIQQELAVLAAFADYP
jgi:hypothetical protein